MRGVAGATAGFADRRRRAIGAVAAALLVALAIVLAFVGGEGTGEETIARVPEIVDAAALSELEADLGHPVYWLGARPPARIEREVDEAGNVFVRYLPPGVPPADPATTYTTVGTYPVTDAAAATRRFARGAGARVLAGPGGAVVVPNPDAAGSVYLAHPGSDLQIEVYDPRPGRALRLIREGAVGPVG